MSETFVFVEEIDPVITRACPATDPPILCVLLLAAPRTIGAEITLNPLVATLLIAEELFKVNAAPTEALTVYPVAVALNVRRLIVMFELRFGWATAAPSKMAMLVGRAEGFQLAAVLKSVPVFLQVGD